MNDIDVICLLSLKSIKNQVCKQPFQAVWKLFINLA